MQYADDRDHELVHVVVDVNMLMSILVYGVKCDIGVISVVGISRYKPRITAQAALCHGTPQS